MMAVKEGDLVGVKRTVGRLNRNIVTLGTAAKPLVVIMLSQAVAAGLDSWAVAPAKVRKILIGPLFQ